MASTAPNGYELAERLLAIATEIRDRKEAREKRVGPEGYVHGWIKVGADDSQPRARAIALHSETIKHHTALASKYEDLAHWHQYKGQKAKAAEMYAKRQRSLNEVNAAKGAIADIKAGK